MKNLHIILILALVLFSCGEQKKKSHSIVKKPKKHHGIKLHDKGDSDNAMESFDKKNIGRSELLDNGISVKWFQETFEKNPTLKDGEVCLISYRVSLPNGKIIDGNNRINLPFIPFMVGYNMQFKGWDIGIKQLKVGDFAKIEIPSELAYANQGLAGIVPANSPIWVYIKLIAKVSPEYNQNGVKVWTFDQGSDGEFDNTQDKEVIYQMISSSKNKASIQNSFTKKFPFRYTIGQKNVLPGLKRVLKNAKKGQKIFVLLSPEQAYGKKGYADMVSPKEHIFCNITVTDIKGN